MDALLYAYTAFLALIWLGLVAITLANTLSAKGSKAYSPRRGYAPKALVMVPCKGTDLTLRDNLLSLKRQRYRNYDVIAIVDSESDPAMQAILEAGLHHIVSAKRWPKASGKVRALSTALTRFRGYDAYVVADSDATFGEDWLELLVAPLADRRTGVSTAFPYFRPVGGFWSKVKLVWGFVGNGMMESPVTRFAWGGSMAFRKGFLDAKSFSEFSASVSDDIPITRIAKRKGLGICYVPERVVTVNSNDDFARFREWSNRQAALTILGNRKNLHYGVVLYSANILLLVSAIALSVLSNPLLAVLLLPFAIGAARTYSRAGTSDPALFVAYLMINFIYLANLLHARSMGSIEWRGTRYSLR